MYVNNTSTVYASIYKYIKLNTYHEVLYLYITYVFLWLQVYFTGSDNSQMMNFRFSDYSGELILKGGLDYCSSACDLVAENKPDNAPPSLQREKPDCFDCRSDTVYTFDIDRVTHVTLESFGIATYSWDTNRDRDCKY